MKQSNFIDSVFKLITTEAILLALVSNIALADISWTTGAYSNDEGRSQILSIADATSLTVNVSGDTEKNYNYSYIYGKDDNQVKKLYSDNLYETFEVTRSSIRARLTVDSSANRQSIAVSIESDFT